MIKYIFIIIIQSLALFAFSQHIETFDQDSANWIYGYGANYTSGTTTWNPAGGAPDGHISGLSENLYAVWTYETAEFGDLRGLSITVDTKISDASTGDAQFYIGRNGTYYISTTWNISNNTNWSTYSTPLNTNNLSHWGGGSSNPLEYVLEAPDDIGIFFGASVANGSGDLQVDNFGVLPDPIQTQDDIAFANKNRPVLIDVLANDNGLLSTYAVSSVTQPSHGTVTIALDHASITYSPQTNFLGQETFTYTATNDFDTASANVTVTTIEPSASSGILQENGTNSTVTFFIRSALRPAAQTRPSMMAGNWTNLPSSGTALPRIQQFTQSPEDPNNYTLELLMNLDHSKDFFRIIVPNSQ